MTTSTTVQRMAAARIPTDVGTFQLCFYNNNQDNKEHLALVYGDAAGGENVLVRVHSECFTGDVLGSLRCDCGPQLRRAMEQIAQAGRGVIVYLRQEGRGIGLMEKLRAYNLQDEGYDTVEANLMLGHEADSRDYTLAAAILQDLGVCSLRLMTNNPAKIEGLRALGLQVTGRVPLQADLNRENASYLATKVERMRHLLDLGPMHLASSRNGRVHTLAAALNHFQPKAARPFITLTYAQSLDGSIASQPGKPTPISGQKSLALTHELRASHDAILVGIGTVLADDPRLTVRLAEGDDPLPVVLDSHLRLPLTAKMVQNRKKPLVFTAPDASVEKEQALKALGVQVERVAVAEDGRLSLTAVLETLTQRGINTLMVEGGAAVITQFFTHQMVDRLVITIAPTLLGGLPAISRPLADVLPHPPRLKTPHYQWLGDDLVLFAELVW